MKFLHERTEIAKAINIVEMPVVRIDISKCMDGYEDCYEGDKVVVNDDIRCTVRMYGDQENENWHGYPYMYKRICLMPDAVCLDNSFGKSDVDKMIEWRKAMRVKEGQEVVVYFDKGKEGYLRVMKVSKVTKWVFPTALLEDVE